MFRLPELRVILTIKLKNDSCEIENFVETHLFASCVGYFDRAYYRFYVSDLIKDAIKNE